MKANPQHCPELSGALQGFVLTTCRSEPPWVLEGEGCTCVCVCVCAINCLQAGEGESSCAAANVALSPSRSQGFHFEKGKLVLFHPEVVGFQTPDSHDCSGMTAGLISRQ